MARILLARTGVPATLLDTLVATLGFSKGQLAAGLGLAVPTLNRKLRSPVKFSVSESERVLSLVQRVGRVEGWHAAGGDAAGADFRPGRWLGTWLTTPNAILGAERPLSLLDTADGRTLVGDVLASMEAGAYW